MQSPERKTPASDHAVQDGVPRFGWRCYVLRCPKRRDAAVPTVRGIAPDAAGGFPTGLGGCGRVGRVLRAVRRSSAFCGWLSNGDNAFPICMDDCCIETLCFLIVRKHIVFSQYLS